MQDTYRHKGLRKKLADELKRKGIRDIAVLRAIESVPRHLFLDNAFLEFAYSDKPFPIGFGQTISQPYTVAFQTQLLELKRSDKVLEIGTGSGYQTSILSETGAKVFTIERVKALYDRTQPLLKEMGCTAKTYYGDGYKGLPVYAPYDKILVTAAAPFVPEALLEQLKTGGRLVVPLGEGNTQVMTVYIKNANGTFDKKEYGNFRFVPLLEERRSGK